MGLFDFFKKKKPSADSNDVIKNLLNTLEVYAEAMHYLATCGSFDAFKFERLDEILSRAGVSFGPEKRQEMIAESRRIFPTKTTGGIAELHVNLAETLSQAFQTFNKALYELSPTPETARKVRDILEKYKL